MLHLFQESEIASHCPQANALNKVIQDPPPLYFSQPLFPIVPLIRPLAPLASGSFLCQQIVYSFLSSVPRCPRQRPSSTPASSGDSDLY